MPGMPDDTRREDTDLLVRIAHRYWVDELTQEEISREFALSRPKVQRLLDRARAAGIVEIRVQTPPWLRLDLERDLRTAFGLTDAIVAPERPDPNAQRDAVGQVAAQHLERRLADGMVVAVSHGRDAGRVPPYFRTRRPVAATFVPAMGGSPHVEAPTNPDEIARALAERCGGRSVALFAPAYLESRVARDVLVGQKTVAHALGLAASADVALVGIGGTDDGCTMVRSGCLSVAEMAGLRDRGAVGDLAGNYVDADGQPVVSAHRDRLVALSLDELRAIGSVVAVASEPEKPMAILGTLRSGVIDVLIVDPANARAVLDLAAGRPSPAPDTVTTTGR
jgi:DNA-binding transcriptional regulator LsrR (DeoR family)